MAKRKKASDLVIKAIKRYEDAYEADRVNKTRAYEALSFATGEGQWPDSVRQQRETDGNLCLTVNMCPAFISQVSNDIRMSAPAVQVVATGGIAEDEPNEKRREAMASKAAQFRQSLIRHVENRSDAQAVAYAKAADDLVTCGYGAWRVTTEYASATSLLQEIKIDPIMDAVGIVWDADAVLPTREDAGFCFVPVDMTREAFKEKYPDATEASMKDSAPEYAGAIWRDWVTEDTIRVCEYWYRERKKRKFISPDGARLIPVEDEDAADIGGKLIEREADCVYRAVISATEVLEEPKEWPGMLIPIIPVLGPEIVIGALRFRHGLIEHAKDAQRRLNFFASAHAQAAAMQPKAPFIGTDKHFEGFEAQWSKANTANYPYLKYNHDPRAPGGPQRSPPALASQGYAEGIELALGDMKRIIGIYDAALGQRSNETSGVAIQARQRESDVGSFAYAQNFARAIRHTGRVLLGLMPRIYDTERTFRIMGQDGKIDPVTINKAATVEDAENAEASLLMNDITAGEFDVVLEQGPSYTTKRQEAKEGMLAFLQTNPAASSIIGDLVAMGMDWPNKEQVARRLRAAIPPQILDAEKAEEQGELGEENMQPPPPPPEMIAQIEQQVLGSLDAQAKQADIAAKQMDIEKKRLEIVEKQMAMGAPQEMPQAPDQSPLIMKQMEVEGSIEAERIKAQAQIMAARLSRGDEMDEADPETGQPKPKQSDMMLQGIMMLAEQMAQQSNAMAQSQAATGDAIERLAAVMAAPKTVTTPEGRTFTMNPAV